MKINFIKKIFLFIFFNLIFCNISLANTFVYECNLNTKYKNGKDGKECNQNYTGVHNLVNVE